MKYTKEQVEEAKKYGWDINPETGEWSGRCNVCSEYKVMGDNGITCQPCIDEHRSMA